MGDRRAWPTALADEGWVITSFNSDITIAPDSTLTIKEDIRVDFQGLQKHGIFRTIPTRYRYDDTRDRVYELGSSEEMSVVTALNKGAVSVPAPLLEARQRPSPQDWFDIASA